MSVPAVLIRKSTKEIIKQDMYPRADMQPVQGLDPDYEWLVKHIPFAEPDYDSRIFIMVTQLPDLNFLENFQQHPDYVGIREYRITYSPEKRPNEDIIRSIENAEKEANDLVWKESEHKDGNMFMMNSVYKDAKGLELTAEEQAQIDKLNLVTVNLAKNKATKEIKIAQVLVNQEPNIDEGWERSL
ncbi:hypothetical protein D3C85_538410 [compost metagenome]